MKTRRKYIEPTLTEKHLAIRNMILVGSVTGSGGNGQYGGDWARQRNSHSELNFISEQSSVEQINWDF